VSPSRAQSIIAISVRRSDELLPDSFIIQYDKETKLRRILDQATHQITSSGVGHDIKNEQNSHNVTVSGNIKNYQQPVSIEFNTPIKIKPTRQYELRRHNFYKRLELQADLGEDQSS
jgi:N6-adenosine-specific RNA methylase IME4